MARRIMLEFAVEDTVVPTVEHFVNDTNHEHYFVFTDESGNDITVHTASLMVFSKGDVEEVAVNGSSEGSLSGAHQ